MVPFAETGVMTARAYIERRRQEQLTDREIWRCLKRSLARRFHHLLLHDLANRPLT